MYCDLGGQRDQPTRAVDALGRFLRAMGVPSEAIPENADEQLVYQITKTLFEKKDELVKVHKDASFLELANQATGASPIPFHPGAARYYREKGIALR